MRRLIQFKKATKKIQYFKTRKNLKQYNKKIRFCSAKVYE